MLNRLFVSFWVMGALLPSSAFAKENSFQHWLIQEPRPDGRVRVKVVEEDSNLRAFQSKISQQVIFTRIYPKNEVPTLASILSNEKTSQNIMADPPAAGNPLWVPVKNTWTEADEDAYSAWIASSAVDEDFDQDVGLAADCADIGLLFRWVYARNHLLPIANTLVGSGKLFGHFSGSADWDKLPTHADWKKDERFKAALRYLFGNTFTGTVVGDLYPTLINPQYVRAGSMFMIIRPQSGHTQTIKKVDPGEGITTLWGNEPASDEIDQTEILIEFENKETFGRWRAPILNGPDWTLLSADQMPGYSLEQFGQNFQSELDFRSWIDQRLGIQVSDERQLESLERDFENVVRMRKKITAQSLIYCVYQTCVTTSTDYDNYSTFARDARLKKEITKISALMTKMGASDPAVQGVMEDLQYDGEIVTGTGLTYLSLIQDPGIAPKLNPDPTVSYAARWGLDQSLNEADMNYLSLAQGMFDLLGERTKLVDTAQYECEEECDPNSSEFKALDTTILDQGIKLVFPNLLMVAGAPNVSAAATTAVKQSYTSSEVDDLYNSACVSSTGEGEEGSCTYQDIVWGTGAASRVNNWTANPQDAVNKRWGF